MALDDKYFTDTLTDDTFTIDRTMGITTLAMKLVSGSGTYQGTKTIGTRASTALSLVVDEPVTISGNEAISELIIDCSGGGVIELIGR